MIRQIICGYNPGAEMGATLAAFDYNKRIGFEAIKVRGYSENPEAPWLEKAFGEPMAKYKLTVDAAHGVIIFSPEDAKGIRALSGLCRSKGKPFWIFSHNSDTSPLDTGKWIVENRIRELAIFGLREEKSPGIQDRTFVSVLDIIGMASVAEIMSKSKQKKENR